MSWARSLSTMLAGCVSPAGSVTVHECAPLITCALVTTSPRPLKTIPDPRLCPHRTCTTAGETLRMTFTICFSTAVAEAGAGTAAALCGALS
jgi:hypothetical protein